MDEYPPPDDRWIRIGKNAYKLPWSKMTDEEIGERLMDFKNEFRNMFRKSLVKKNQEILKKSDDDIKQIVQRNIEFEVDKNENRMVDDILSQMNLTKNDWKKSFDLDEMGIS